MPQATRTFRLFVSSTFSDMAAEREVLHREVFPALRALCAAHGCRFQAIDLRWGVSQEAALDQRTMEICLREIARCQEVTPRPNFIVLLGDRYGWRPLPADIAAAEFDALLAAAGEDDGRRPRVRALLRKWYRRDDNAMPPVFVLQPREVKAPKGASEAEIRAAREEELGDWSRDELRLRAIIRAAAVRAGFAAAHPLRRFPSATEQEILMGALEGEGASDRVFCFFRDVAGEPPDDTPKDVVRRFRETHTSGRAGREADESQRQLKAALRRAVGPEAVVEAAASWTRDGISLDHLSALSRAALAALEQRIQAEIDRFEAESPLESERESHRAHAARLAADFVETPRAGELARIAAAVAARPGRVMAVTGASGSGKSALLAVAAAHAGRAGPGAVLVQRFLGLTPRSADPRTLLADLCEEIGAAYGQHRDPPADFRLLAAELSDRLALATADRPLLLFLDALDQISEAESAHHLVWLPADLPPHTAIVVSTLPGECHRALERKHPPVDFVTLGDLSTGEGGGAAEILDSIVASARRRLQPAQRAHILDAARHSPSPLFLRLAAAEAIRWRSYATPAPLAGSVDGLIEAYLRGLALPVNHGGVLVARSLGYLAAAKRGLTEDELLDALSADPDVLTDFERRSQYGHELPERRLPVVVWSRLSFDLQPYLTERQADGTSVMVFYHSQLRRIVGSLYLEPAAAALHGALAAYFHDQKPLTGAGRIQVRRVSELPFHQIHAEDWNALDNTLGDLDFLDLKARAELVYDTIDDFELLESRASVIPIADGIRTRMADVARAYNQEFRTFQQRPIAGQQLFNNLVAHQGLDGSAGAALRAFVLRRTIGGAWLRRLNAAPETVTSRELARTLAAHDGAVTAVSISPGLSRIATGGADGFVRVWNERNGGLAASIKGDGAAIAAVAWMPGDDNETLLVSADVNGLVRLLDWRSESERRRWMAGHRVRALTIAAATRIITCGDDRQLRVFDASSGAPLATLQGHADRVLCVAAVPGRAEVVSGSEDRTLRGWTLEPPATQWVLRGAEDSIRAVAVAPGGDMAVSGGDDRQPRLWRIDKGSERSSGPVGDGHRHPARCVGFVTAGAADLRVVAGGSETLHVWDASSGADRGVMHGHAGSIDALATAGRAGWFVSGGEDGTARVWETTGRAARRAVEHRDRVDALAVTPDRLIVTGSADHTIKVWSDEDGAVRGTLRGHLDAVTAVIALPGRRVASASADRTVRIWDLDRGDTLATFGAPIDLSGLPTGGLPPALAGRPGHKQAVTCLAALGGERLASGSRDGTVRIWNLDTRAPDGELRTGRGVIERLLIAPTVRALVATGTAREGTLWHLDDPATAIPLAGHTGRIGCAAVADGAGLAVTGGYDGDVRIWRLDSGRCAAVGKGHDGWVVGVDCDSEASTIASAGRDGTLRVWSARDGSLIRTIEAHGGGVRELALDERGARVASCGEDGWLRIWEIATGDELAAAHLDSPVTALRWSKGDVVLGTRWGGLGIFRLEG